MAVSVADGVRSMPTLYELSNVGRFVDGIGDTASGRTKGGDTVGTILLLGRLSSNGTDVEGVADTLGGASRMMMILWPSDGEAPGEVAARRARVPASRWMRGGGRRWTAAAFPPDPKAESKMTSEDDDEPRSPERAAGSATRRATYIRNLSL